MTALHKIKKGQGGATALHLRSRRIKTFAAQVLRLCGHILKTGKF
jgi:hypothetical protein